MASPDAISRALAAVIRRRALVLIVYALLVPLAIYMALHIPRDSAIDRLIVPGDADYVATQEFHKIFPEPQTVLLVVESPDPWAPAAIARVERATAAVRSVPHVSAFSPLDVLRRAKPQAPPEELKRLAEGTRFFRDQGLAGAGFLAIVADLDVRSPDDRDAALAAIDAALAKADIGDVRRVGAPYASAWIEHASAGSIGPFVLFGVLLVGIALFLFGSWRALLAIVGALGAAVALAVAAGGALGFSFTIISVLVPLTLLVTTLATLVYLHSRFVDRPDELPLEEHHVIALRNKFLPVTASMVAAALGFAALAVSNIRPVRELGIWTAVGLVLGWLVSFTLFPALQRVLRTPTGRTAHVRDTLYERISQLLPGFTRRFRWPLVVGALAACAIGGVMLFGIPGVVGGASVEVDALTNIDPAATVADDLRWFRANVMDGDAARIWIHLPDGNATDSDVLRAIDGFQSALEARPEVIGVAGPTTALRMRRYFAGQGEKLPTDAEGFAQVTEDFEQLLLSEPALRGFIDVGSLSDVQLIVQFRGHTTADYNALTAQADVAWQAAEAQTPALEGSRMRVVGDLLLQAKVGADLVPTLAESFLLTAALILVVFLFVFRSGIERVLAMIPSLFAILVTFLGMRVLGGSLNVATIIIGTTILGTTENDQIHFFHHMHEVGGAPLEERLRHSLRVSGRAIVFATFINAAGFLGLATSSFPPLRQFGIMTCAAFLLALLADFIALPAALWIAQPRLARLRPTGRDPS
jgi:predicted RND superfamily exporter protein